MVCHGEWPIKSIADRYEVIGTRPTGTYRDIGLLASFFSRNDATAPSRSTCTPPGQVAACSVSHRTTPALWRVDICIHKFQINIKQGHGARAQIKTEARLCIPNRAALPLSDPRCANAISELGQGAKPPKELETPGLAAKGDLGIARRACIPLGGVWLRRFPKPGVFSPRRLE